MIASCGNFIKIYNAACDALPLLFVCPESLRVSEEGYPLGPQKPC